MKSRELNVLFVLIPALSSFAAYAEEVPPIIDAVASLLVLDAEEMAGFQGERLFDFDDLPDFSGVGIGWGTLYIDGCVGGPASTCAGGQPGIPFPIFYGLPEPL